MKWLVRLFTAVYLAALGLYLAATLGYIGTTGSGEQPLAGIFLSYIGMPWNMFFDADGATGSLAFMLVPAINVGILWLAADLIASRED